MLVREVPFDSQTLILGACSIIMIFCSVCFAVAMIWDDKKWIEALMEKVCIRFILPLGLVFIAGVMATGTALSSSPRPVAEGDYESVGTYTATVTRVYPHDVEVETEYGVSLPVPASMMPEGASAVGTTVVIDVSKLSSKPGLEVQRPSGDASSADSSEPIFVENDACKSSGLLSCAEVFGDAKVGARFLPSLYYGVTGVRAS